MFHENFSNARLLLTLLYYEGYFIMQEKKNSVLPANQMLAVLDNAPVAILVSGLDNYELIYRNKKAEKFFPNVPGKTGMKCYEAAGRNTPCPQCESDRIDEDDTLVRQFRFPVDDRIYQRSGKTIKWGDRPAHIEYILDITEEQKEKKHAREIKEELAEVNEKMQFIINTIPGGIAIYKISDRFEMVYFSDGVPEITGNTMEEYQESIRQDVFRLVYHEDRAALMESAQEAIKTHRMVSLEFRKMHRDGHIVWVRAQAVWIGEEGGFPLLHCIFHNITDLKEAQLEMNHLINSVPGGIASYQVEGDRFIPIFFSDGMAKLSGHTRAEMEELVGNDAAGIIYEADRERVIEKARTALVSGESLDISYRMRHKNGSLVWIHMNGRRIGPVSESIRFYAVFTGMTAERQLFESIADETADGIYVIDKDTYELLYVNEPSELFGREANFTGLKCYDALMGKNEPCESCPLCSYGADRKEHLLDVDAADRFYSARFKEIDWNGIPAYVEYLRDVTDEVHSKREKERLEEYFRTMVKYLPGGVAVLRYDKAGKLIPEFLSEGFVAMTGRSQDEMLQVYQEEVTGGIYPDDKEWVQAVIKKYVNTGTGDCDFVYRMMRSDGNYFWVKNTLSVIHSGEGEKTIYAGYIDITNEQEEKEQLRSQYNEMLMQHYRVSGPNVLIVGHCNITQNRMLEIIDYTDSDLLHTYGSARSGFYAGLAALAADSEEKQQFESIYYNEPSIAAYRHGETELSGDFFIKLPREELGRYARFVVKLVETPDTGDLTGVLSVTDITEETISSRILNQLSFSNYETVVKVDLPHDRYEVLAGKIAGIERSETLGDQGCHSACLEYLLEHQVVLKDQERTAEMLSPEYILKRLNTTGAYTFSYGVQDPKGNMLTKSMTVSPVDLRLKRICLAITDVTCILAAERQSQMELEKALKLAEEANRAKSDFLSSMSHDIRTPMNAIMGMTTVAQAQADNPEKVLDCLKKIELSSKHLLSLINDILDMSKIERSKITLNRTEICLSELINQVSSMIQPRAREAGNCFTLRADGIIHPYFYGDDLRVTQILINILGNAVKFTPEGGTVELAVEEIPLLREPSHARFLFTVSDTGIGMQEEFLSRIFEPFTRNRGTDHVEGTGLGLSITKGLVDLMDGKITVDSCLNQGTCFRVELEFEASFCKHEIQKNVKEENIFNGIALEGRKFLIAEDNALNSEILCELLKMCGAQTEVQEDGILAIQAFTENQPGTYDAVLMDIQMPRMNGYEASRAIRAMERADAKTIPIIAMTANAFTEDILASKEAGMNAHVAKPVDMKLLWDVLSQTLGIRQ